MQRRTINKEGQRRKKGAKEAAARQRKTNRVGFENKLALGEREKEETFW